MNIKNWTETLKNRINTFRYSHVKPNFESDEITDTDLEDALNPKENDSSPYFSDENEYVPRVRNYGYHRNYLKISGYKAKMIGMILFIIIMLIIVIYYLSPGHIPALYPN